MPLDLPGIHHAADTLSLRAQREYKMAISFSLIAGLASAVASLVGSLITPLNPLAASILFGIAGGGGVLIVSSLAMIAHRRPDQRWYMARAIAESVKSVAWRFSMKAAPFQGGDQAATENVVAVYKQLLAYAGNAGLSISPGEEDYLTQDMKDLRAEPCKRRLVSYLEDRIENQRGWYRRKSIAANRSVRHWFIVIIAAYCAMSLCSLWSLLEPSEVSAGLASVLLCGATSAAAWLQVRRDQELGKAYGFTAHELGLVRLTGQYVGTEADLSAFVADAESAMSREHTTWLARRDVLRPETLDAVPISRGEVH